MIRKNPLYSDAQTKQDAVTISSFAQSLTGGRVQLLGFDEATRALTTVTASRLKGGPMHPEDALFPGDGARVVPIGIRGISFVQTPFLRARCNALGYSISFAKMFDPRTLLAR